MKWIVGIDEVGRGALAGPVVVAAALLPAKASFKNHKLGLLKDSKKLSAAQREAWLSFFLNHGGAGGDARGGIEGNAAPAPKVICAIARVYPRQIERHNISNAANLAAARAFARLEKSAGLKRKTKVFLDGGLFLGNHKNIGFPNAKTIVKGDEKINAVKVASIIAKVHRDRFMQRLAKKYPKFGFEIHKGYGTKLHRAAIAKHGPSPAHRLTFLDKFFMMNPYGRRTSKTSFKGESGPAPVASRHEKAAPFRLQALRRAETRASRLPPMRKEIGFARGSR